MLVQACDDAFRFSHAVAALIGSELQVRHKLCEPISHVGAGIKDRMHAWSCSHDGPCPYRSGEVRQDKGSHEILCIVLSCPQAVVARQAHHVRRLIRRPSAILRPKPISVTFATNNQSMPPWSKAKSQLANLYTSRRTSSTSLRGSALVVLGEALELGSERHHPLDPGPLRPWVPVNRNWMMRCRSSGISTFHNGSTARSAPATRLSSTGLLGEVAVSSWHTRFSTT